MSEVRLIDADALMVSKDWANCTCPAQVIHKAPTIDAVPVVHGRWVKENCQGDYGRCSKCNCRIPWTPRNYNFCPSCGARMDGCE